MVKKAWQWWTEWHVGAEEGSKKVGHIRWEVQSCSSASGEWGRWQGIQPVYRHSLGQGQEPRQDEQLLALIPSFHILSDLWMLGSRLEKSWWGYIIGNKTDMASHLVGFMVKRDRGHQHGPYSTWMSAVLTVGAGARLGGRVGHTLMRWVLLDLIKGHWCVFVKVVLMLAKEWSCVCVYVCV